MNKKIAFITGVTGQDGSYLAEFLLKKGYEVHGLVRRSSSFNRDRLNRIYQDANFYHEKFFLHYGDMCDAGNLIQIIKRIKPDEIYHLAAQSHVQVSFETPEFTAQTDAIGTLRLLEAIKMLNLANKVKFYNATTSELYGKVQETPQNEETPFYPRSPYGVAKLYSFWIVKNYREAYNIFACNGILFNHESERRGESFVTRKITMSLAGVKLGKLKTIHLGNLDAKRDWGYAPDYVEAMWLMLQQDKPKDLVIATGETHSVREFVEVAAKELGMTIEWQGSGLDEKGIDKNTGKIIVEIDKHFFRPCEVDLLLGDASLAKKTLGWEPKVKFKELAKLMITHDFKQLERELKQDTE